MMIGCNNPTWNRPIEERKEFLKKNMSSMFFWYCHPCIYFAKFDIIIFQSFTFENEKSWQLIILEIWE